MKRIVALLLSVVLGILFTGCSLFTVVMSSDKTVRSFSGSTAFEMDGTGELKGEIAQLNGDYAISEKETEGALDLTVSWEFTVEKGETPSILYESSDKTETDLTQGQESGTATVTAEENGRFLLRGNGCDLYAVIQISASGGVQMTEEQKAVVEKSNRLEAELTELVNNYANGVLEQEDFSKEMEDLEKTQKENIVEGLNVLALSAEEREEILPVLQKALENFMTVMDEIASSCRTIADQEGAAPDFHEFSGKLEGVFSGLTGIWGTLSESADDLRADEKAIKELEETYREKVPSDYLRSITFGSRDSEALGQFLESFAESSDSES